MSQEKFHEKLAQLNNDSDCEFFDANQDDDDQEELEIQEMLLKQLHDEEKEAKEKSSNKDRGDKKDSSDEDDFVSKGPAQFKNLNSKFQNLNFDNLNGETGQSSEKVNLLIE
jgi:hypothetical protein